MKDNLTFIAVVLDRSGSMSNIKIDTIGGFNTFLAEQKQHPGEALLTLAQFDDHYDIVHDGKALAEVPDLTDQTFVPRGSTALNDAIGRTIDSVGAKLAAMSEADRPGKVIVLVLTDGGENASREYTGSRVAEMIKKQTDTYKWSFVFMGANQDSFATARALNIPVGNTANYAANPGGTKAVFTKMGMGMRSLRSSQEQSTSNYFDPNAKDSNEP